MDTTYRLRLTSSDAPPPTDDGEVTVLDANDAAWVPESLQVIGYDIFDAADTGNDDDGEDG